MIKSIRHFYFQNLSRFQRNAVIMDVLYVISKNLSEIPSNFHQIGAKYDDIAEKMDMTDCFDFAAKSLAEFLRTIEIGAVQKWVHLVRSRKNNAEK